MSRFVVFFLSLTIFIYGCCGIAETVRGAAGVSTKILEDGRKEALAREVNCGYQICYEKVKAALKLDGSYIYAGSLKKHMFALYISEEDTTPVGVFFSEIGALNTRVEVSSPSTYAKELILARITSALEKEGAK
jgi:hypothetical protein